jgi:hypothetical protein
MAKTPNLKLALKKSKDFYTRAGLKTWLKDLPKAVKVPKEHEHLVKKAASLNLDHCMVFPDFRIQVKSLNRVIKETVVKPVEGIPEHLEYAGPYISHNWSKTPSGKVHQAQLSREERMRGPYLLYHNILQVHPQTRGKKATQIAKLFEKEQWNGFTSPEFLVCQRRWRESLVEDGIKVTKMDFKDYRWTWLVDSMDKENCAVAYFGPQVVGLYGCKVGSANKLRSANVTVVVPLR